MLVHFGSDEQAANFVVETIRGSGGSADKVAADLSTANGPHELARQVRTLVGERLDVLVANAGISKASPLAETTVEDFDRLFAAHVH